MPVARLDVDEMGVVTTPDPSGRGVYLPVWRLRVWTKIGGESAARQVVLDTGSPLCVFSKRVWSEFDAAGRIEWVGHPPAAGDPPEKPSVTLLGGEYRFRVGRVSVEVVDLNGGGLPPVPVLVQCVEDDRKPLPRVLVVGLWGLLNGRTMVLTASADGARWAATLVEP